MDIVATIGRETAYNWHSHTQFCDGRATMAEFAQAAVAEGFLHYGFSPHSPLCIPSPCNMSEADVPVYLAEVRRLQELYTDSPTRFYAGMEIDYMGPHWGPATDYFQSIPLDYRIGSVHFVPSPRDGHIDVDGRFENFRKKMEAHFDNDIEYVVRAFYAQTLEMIAAGGFDIIGHFDKIGQNASYFRPDIEDEPWYQALVSQTIDAIIASGVIVELNTKACTDHHRFFPNPRYLRRLVDANIPIIVNSDAHYPALINASRDLGLKLLFSIPFQ